jgi:hypothetical protein
MGWKDNKKDGHKADKDSEAEVSDNLGDLTAGQAEDPIVLKNSSQRKVYFILRNNHKIASD